MLDRIIVRYVTEPYQLYCIMMFEKLRNQFIEYIISKINEDIKRISDTTSIMAK